MVEKLHRIKPGEKSVCFIRYPKTQMEQASRICNLSAGTNWNFPKTLDGATGLLWNKLPSFKNSFKKDNFREKNYLNCKTLMHARALLFDKFTVMSY